MNREIRPMKEKIIYRVPSKAICTIRKRNANIRTTEPNALPNAAFFKNSSKNHLILCGTKIAGIAKRRIQMIAHNKSSFGIPIMEIYLKDKRECWIISLLSTQNRLIEGLRIDLQSW